MKFRSRYYLLLSLFDWSTISCLLVNRDDGKLSLSKFSINVLTLSIFLLYVYLFDIIDEIIF